MGSGNPVPPNNVVIAAIPHPENTHSLFFTIQSIIKISFSFYIQEK